MFSDTNIEITGFHSCPESERLVSDGSSQTFDLKSSNQEAQTIRMSSKEVQASPEEALRDKPPVYDADRLLTFLNRIMPHLEEELKNSEDNLNCNDGYGDGEGKEKCVELYSQQTKIQPEFCKERIISDLTWNSTGMLLAVSSSEKGHEAWCSHESFVGIYNTGKDNFERIPPIHLLQVSACVQCIQFHPYIPSLLGGGLHSGEVVVWDLTNEEVMMNNKNRSGHQGAHVDAITCLTWREDRNNVWLVTTGRDGKIIFWKVTTTSLTCEPHQRFLILKHHLTAAAAPNEHLEVLHVSFWPQRESDFVVAAAGGSIFHCSLATAKPLSSVPGHKDPVRMAYKPHEGIVTCVACLPNSDMFASCGMDSEIHLYKSEKTSPLSVIHTKYPVLGVEWIKGSKHLLSWGCSSKVECRKMGEFNATTICEFDGGVSAFAANSKRQGKMAVGSQTGEVLIISEDGV